MNFRALSGLFEEAVGRTEEWEFTFQVRVVGVSRTECAHARGQTGIANHPFVSSAALCVYNPSLHTHALTHQMSMLEIYNETVLDLLSEGDSSARGGLDIRQVGSGPVAAA